MIRTGMMLEFACIGVCILTTMTGVAEEKFDKRKYASYQEYMRSKTILRKRLDNLVIPKCSFEDTDIKTVIKYIRQKAKEIDPDAAGFNVFFRCKKDAQTQTITLEMENVPVRDLLRFVCLAAQKPINFKIEKHAVVITDRGAKEKVNKY